jgi:heme exporter protein D
MSLPSTRRHRLITKKIELEQERKARMEAASRRK